MRLRFVEHPPYAVAHPDDDYLDMEVCRNCAIAEDNNGERYLLWQSNGVHWALSRHDRRYNTEARVSAIELVYE